MSSAKIDLEKLVSDNEELRSRIEQLENAIKNTVKPSTKAGAKAEVKKPQKKNLKEIIFSWSGGKAIGLCPRFIASPANESGQDYCGAQITGYHDKDGVFVRYEHDKREKDDDFVIGIEEFCRSRCDKCVNKGLAPTAKHTRNIIQEVKGTPEKVKAEKRNVGASVTGITLPAAAVKSPSPDDGVRIYVGEFIDQIIDIENLKVVLRRAKNKDGSPRAGRLPRVIGCYYNDEENEYDGTNPEILCKLPGEAIRAVGNVKNESETLPALKEKEKEKSDEDENIVIKPSIAREEDQDSEDEQTDELLRQINITL